MHTIHSNPETVLIADAQIDLPSPPVAFGSVVHWARKSGTTPEFDLEVWANASTNLSNASLYGGIPHPIVLADDAVEAVDIVDNDLTLTAHAYTTGDGPVRLTSSGVLPTGLALATDYWVIVVDANTIALAASLENAINGTRIDLTGAGSGTHTIADTASTKRIAWSLWGLLGAAADGAVTLTARLGYVTRARHSPHVVAYALVASLSASDPEAVSAAVTPIVEP